MGGCVGKSVVTCVWPQVQINWVKDEKLWEGKIWSVAWRGLWCVRVWWRWPFHIFLIGCVIRTKQNSRLLSFVKKKEKKKKKKNPRPSVRLKLCRLSDWRKKNWPTPVHRCNSTAVTKRLKKRIIIISLSFSVSAVIFLLFLYFLSSFIFCCCPTFSACVCPCRLQQQRDDDDDDDDDVITVWRQLSRSTVPEQWAGGGDDGSGGTRTAY